MIMRAERRREDELLQELLDLLDWYYQEYEDFERFYEVLREDVQYVFKEKDKIDTLKEQLNRLFEHFAKED